MKKFLAILFLLPLLVSCEQEDTILSERDKIEKYLTSSRRMVEKSEVGNVIEDNPAFYEIFGRYAYRHIVNYYDEGREDKPVVEWGDKVEIRFDAYTFTGSEPAISNLYWSNIHETILEVGDKSNYTLDWSEEPLTIVLGQTEILEGLELTLPGCHEADSVQVYMTSNLAYGKKLIGVVPKNSMVAWYMKIEKVTK
ncbi:MAG: FKBP-type peptidyl-prolyl cis-trans isomerase [Alistipes sp.]|nr:FKBP-type peptidyl-prolyl cis-trans isomerase [Alistipes sp.]